MVTQPRYREIVSDDHFYDRKLIYSKESRVEVGACILVHKFVRILSVMDRPNTDPPTVRIRFTET